MLAFKIDPRVEQNWELLNGWHIQYEVTNKFTGHVGKKLFQTYRYVEAARHMMQAKKKGAVEGEEVRVNVCETGFNGGHSAMLFMRLNNEEAEGHVYYYDWNLKAFRAATPTVEKMKETFGEYFHITWGDSAETLKEADSVLQGQLCDIVVVDGVHSKEGVTNDWTNFLKVVRPGTIVFSDDCAPPNGLVQASAQMKEAWDAFVERKEILSVASYRNPTLKYSGFVEGVIPDGNGEYTLGI
mmetsp:Transcript_17028/g.24087  ORF Transcript_17028/g.24087 Transcript_17028/m.24087 type:complete len:241 (+) Transcript_17028:1495-2217(+)